MQTLKGFRDYIGPDARKRNWLSTVFRNTFELYGFEPLETPALEYEELLLGKYGEEANKLIYSFEDRGGRRVAMRYDQTVPTARVISQYRAGIPLPYKRYQIQPVWRADKPQRGRYREFLQCDIDTIGTKSPLADAEVLAVISDVFQTLNLPITILVNNRQSLVQTIRESGVEEKDVMSVIQTIDKLDKKSSDEVMIELREKNVTQQQAEKLFAAFESAKADPQLAAIIDAARDLGVPARTLKFTPALARGLDYYTGMILEIQAKDYAGGSLGGGGRYDRLVNDLVGYDVPAVGMAFGFDRILDVLTERELIPALAVSGASVMLASNTLTALAYCAKVSRTLRSANIPVEQYPDVEKKFEAQIKYAVKKGISQVILIGEEEQTTGTVVIKNLSTREQQKVALEEIVQVLARK